MNMRGYPELALRFLGWVRKNLPDLWHWLADDADRFEEFKEDLWLAFNKASEDEHRPVEVPVDAWIYGYFKKVCKKHSRIRKRLWVKPPVGSLEAEDEEGHALIDVLAASDDPHDQKCTSSDFLFVKPLHVLRKPRRERPLASTEILLAKRRLWKQYAAGRACLDRGGNAAPTPSPGPSDIATHLVLARRAWWRLMTL